MSEISVMARASQAAYFVNMTSEPREEIRSVDPEHYRFLLLVQRIVGEILVDKTMFALGIAKRTAERWLGGKPVPDAVIERLERDAPRVEAFVADLDALVERHRGEGLSEHYMRLRMRDYARTLSETAEKDEG